MTIELNLDAAEILRIAEQAEVNGAAFYRQAAEETTDPQQRDWFLHLAAQEDQHRQHFASLRKMTLSHHGAVDAAPAVDDQVMVEFLQGWLDGELLERGRHKAQLALASKRLTDIVEVAAELETDSIAFYSGFLDLIANETDRQLVRKIIKDEMSHLAQMNQMRRKLQP